MSLTFPQLAAQFLTWAESTLSPATVAYYRHHLNGFADQVGHQLASDIKRHVLMAWGRTWHRVQAVQRAYNWAVNDAELLTVNPFARVRKPPMGQRRRTLDTHAFSRLMRAAGVNFRAFLLAARETYARPQEVRAITWECLTWPGQPLGFEAALHAGRVVAVLYDYKSRRLRLDPNVPRVLLISPRLGRLVARLARRTHDRSGPVFLNDRGEAWTRTAARQAMRRLRRRAGLAPDHRGEQVVCYTVRHTQATAAAAAGLRDRLLAEIMGHTTARTTARYQHLEVRHLQDAMDLVRRTRGRAAAGLDSQARGTYT